MTARDGAPGRGSPFQRWGLPRDHRAMEHVVTFVVVAMATILVTRLFLIATGYPQVGGDGLHIAHVLWGGALMVVATVALLLYIGPVVRPFGVLVGGIGFGLFIDEVGKFLTDDNDYFYAPAFSIMYASGVAVVVLAQLVLARRQRVPAEDLAAAADLAVSGLVGGFSPRQRAAAEALLARAGDQSGAEQVRALLDAVPDDDDELPDPVRAVVARASAFARRVVDERLAWRVASIGGGLVLAASTVVAATDVSPALDAGVAFVPVIALVSLVAAWALWGAGLRVRSRGGADASGRATGLVRAGIAVNLLVTQVSLFRFDAWQATTLVIAGLVILVVLWAEDRRSDGGVVAAAAAPTR